MDLEVNNNRPTGGIILHNIERARFLPPIKIINLAETRKNLLFKKAFRKCDDSVVISFCFKVDLLLNAFDGMNVQEQQPPSIFECQLRLFGQWFNEWTDDERNSMINKLEAFDPDLVAKFHELIRQSKTLS